MTETEVKEFKDLLGEIQSGWGQVKGLPDAVQGLKEGLSDVKRSLLARSGENAVRPQGDVTEGCARFLAAQFINSAEKSVGLDAIASIAASRDALSRFATDTLGIAKTALGTSDVPLPSVFGGEIRQLISEFGVARRAMSHYPIGMGTARPARMGARPSFGSIAMSAVVPEKSPGLEYASLESHKIGGIVRVPRELDEQSMVPLGRFLATYGATEFARAEDTWAFLGDGSATYEGVKGLCKIASDSGCLLTLGATKTKPSDVTRTDLRNVRSLANKAILHGKAGAYYLDASWEPILMGMNDAANPYFFQRLPDGTCRIDGYPLIFTDVMLPYSATAQNSKYACVFGALRYWWFGEHGNPRIDTSEHVWFANDQLAVRFIEEIDFDYMATDAVAAIQLAAA